MELHAYNRIAAYEDIIANLQGFAPVASRPSVEVFENQTFMSLDKESTFVYPGWMNLPDFTQLCLLRPMQITLQRCDQS